MNHNYKSPPEREYSSGKAKATDGKSTDLGGKGALSAGVRHLEKHHSESRHEPDRKHQHAK